MTDVFQTPPGGLSALANLIRSYLPASPYASPQETPPEPTPGGGLPGAAPGQGEPGIRSQPDFSPLGALARAARGAIPTPSNDVPPAEGPLGTPSGGLPDRPQTMQPGEEGAPDPITGLRSILSGAPPGPVPFTAPGSHPPPGGRGGFLSGLQPPSAFPQEPPRGAAQAATPPQQQAALPPQQQATEPKLPPGAKPPAWTPGWDTTVRENFQAFVPNSAREVGSLGKKWEPIESLPSNPDIVRSPKMPAPREAYPVIQGAGQQLNRWASPGVGGPAGIASAIAGLITPIMDYISGGAFSPAFGKAQAHALANQAARLKMNREFYEQQRDRMLDATEDSQREHQKQLTSYDEVLQRYKLGAISADEAREEIRRLNNQYGHHNLDAVLERGDLGAVERYLKWEDAKMRDMWSGSASLRQSDRDRKKKLGLSEDTDLDKEYSIEGGGAKQGERPLPVKGPLAEAGGEGGAPAAPQGYANDVDEEIGKRRGLSPTGMEAARELMNTGKVGNLTGGQLQKAAPRTFDNIVTAAGDLRNRINQTASGPGSPEEKIEALRQIDPAMADQVQGLRDYRTDPVSLGKNRAALTGLAHQIDHNYNEGFYKIAQKYRDPNSKEGTVMSRTGTLPIATLNVLNALKDFSETDKIPKRVLESLLAEYYTGDPKYAQLYSSLRMFATDAVAISMGSGTPRVTLVNDLIKHMTSTGSPATIRAQLLTDLRIANGYINNANQTWQAETNSNSNAPGFLPQNRRMLDAMLRMNPYTGVVPDDAPDTLKAVGRQQPGGKDRPSWLKPGQDWKPITREQVDGYRRWLQDNPNHPNAQKLREQLGIQD